MTLSPRRLWWTLCGLTLVGALIYAFRPAPVMVEAARCERGMLRVTVSAEGRTRLKDRYLVSAPVPGRLLRVELRPGDAVEKGRTLLAVFEPSDPELLDPRTRAQAEARVRAAVAARQRVETQLARARTAAKYARTERERSRRLQGDGMLSQQELEQAEQADRMAEEEMRAAGFAVEIAEYELEQARAALLGGANADTASGPWGVELHAPISGRVLRVFQESSAVVPAGARLLELGDPRALEIEIEVLSSDAVKIRPGASVLLEHWGGSSPLPARVRVVEPSAFTKISALGVEEQRLYVIADFTGPPEDRSTVGDGFRVEARIVTDEVTDALKVPIGALFREETDWAVFSIEGSRAVRRIVQIGRRNEKEAEVRAGLDGSETLILYPSDRVDEGVRVQRRNGRGTPAAARPQ